MSEYLRLFGALLIVMATLSSTANAQIESKEELPPFVQSYEAAALEKWQADIVKLEELGTPKNRHEQSILFIGSSSIRRWNTIQKQMEPWQAIQRGYGGAKFSDLAVFAERLIRPHQYAALVVFVANDISGSETDKAPEEVLKLVKFVVGQAQKHRPESPVFIIEVTPTSKRWKVWPQIKKVNEAIAEYCKAEKSLYLIKTTEHFLGDDGKPDDSLFVDDLLHLNERGYQVWERLIKTRLNSVLGKPKALSVQGN